MYIPGFFDSKDLLNSVLIEFIATCEVQVNQNWALQISCFKNFLFEMGVSETGFTVASELSRIYNCDGLSKVLPMHRIELYFYFFRH